MALTARVEIMDFALTEDIPYNEVLERMNAQTPVGLEIVSVSKPEHKHTDITAAEYVARLKTDKSVHEVAELFGKFIALDKIRDRKANQEKDYQSCGYKAAYHSA